MSTAATDAVGAQELNESQRRLLFWACFVALIATAFGFIVRTFLIDTWGTEFNLTETEKGQIMGVGLWPFAVSIILFSLVVDRIGYGTAMVFAFLCHVSSAVLTIFATGYWTLYFAMLLAALANGTVEAVINPVVATLFPNEKTKWLNILHAGWPGGLVLGGILGIALGGTPWQAQVGLVLVPTVLYGILMVGRKFPANERVAAGVPYQDMLREFGLVGALIALIMMVFAIGDAFAIDNVIRWVVIGVLTVGFGAISGFSLGRGLFICLVLIMIPLATTELGTDTWITPLMRTRMEAMSLHPGSVLVYTSVIMMVLRFCAGAIVHRISPLGLLAASAAVACLGLLFLSQAEGAMILVAATLYGFGKTFFWPTTLGVVSEQFPRGGALTLNAIAGVGMLGVGVVGAIFLGYIQDTSINRHMQEKLPAVYSQVQVSKPSLFGEYTTIDPEKVKTLTADEQKQVDDISGNAKKEALATVAIFPAIMLAAYLILMAYFKSRGGYKPVSITDTA